MMVALWIVLALAWRFASSSILGGGWPLGCGHSRVRLPSPGCWKIPVFQRILGTATTLDRIGIRPGQRIVEFGPGPGRLLIPAARRVLPEGEVIGIDLQQGMLDRLKRHAERAGHRQFDDHSRRCHTSLICPRTAVMSSCSAKSSVRFPTVPRCSRNASKHSNLAAYCPSRNRSSTHTTNFNPR